MTPQRPPPLLPWVAAGLALVGSLAAYRVYDTSTFEADPGRLASLQRTSLPPSEAGSLAPAEWPQWRGPGRDGVTLETGLLPAWPPEGPRVVWRAPVGQGLSSVAVAGGRAYTLGKEGPEEVVYCWDAADGRPFWRFGYPCALVLDAAHGIGPRATPSADEGRLYCVGIAGALHCLDAGDGRLVWRHDLAGEFGGVTGWRPSYWGYCGSPLVDGDLVVTMTGGGDGAVAAFDKRNGGLVWKSLDDPMSYSSPVALSPGGVRQFVFFTGRGLVGLAPGDGSALWRFPWETKDNCNIATPVGAGSYVFLSSGYDRGCRLVEVTRGTGGDWRAEAVYAHKGMRNHFSSCVLYGECLYGFDNATLVCMEFRTGAVRWRRGGFGKGSLLAADGHLVILGENGRLALAEATPAGYREQASVQVSDNRCWAAPALAGGRLYVRDDEQVTCLDLKNP
jgi:outer membrane protein assembly factor BamB